MASIDHRIILRPLYAPSASIHAITVPRMHFLTIDGTGDPNSSEMYRESVEALFSVAYAAKFILKRSAGTDLRVMPLEGLWWTPDMKDFSVHRKDLWHWRMMIMQPVGIDSTIIAEATEKVRKAKQLPALGRLVYGPFEEGPCAQVLYSGAYSDEAPVIEQMHAFITGEGRRLSGRHHEIYLNDPRRTAPSRLRTILRQPMS